MTLEGPKLDINHRVHARAGLLGNPSDSYYGSCISFALGNFWAEVTLVPSATLQLLPHPVHDSYEYDSIGQLMDQTDTCGFYGGIRLLQAAVKAFGQWCHQSSIQLAANKNFTLSYSTNIPRQTGLSGSSAICCAALNCLMEYYTVAIPLEVRPSVVLAAETELGITAGLQDRVIQVYGGLVFMDFKEANMRSYGHGEYVRMDPLLLQLDGTARFWLVYSENPSESGKVHANVRQRWLDGDQEVRKNMEEVALCARLGKAALESRDVPRLKDLMNRNFDLRRMMFGDQVLGSQNIAMIELARSVGSAAKFTGSGGAALVLCDNEEQAQRLKLLAAGRFVAVPVSACEDSWHQP